MPALANRIHILVANGSALPNIAANKGSGAILAQPYFPFWEPVSCFKTNVSVHLPLTFTRVLLHVNLRLTAVPWVENIRCKTLTVVIYLGCHLQAQEKN